MTKGNEGLRVECLGPASEETLYKHYQLTGTEYPGEHICSRPRWRIYLRRKANFRHYAYPLYHDSSCARQNGAKLYQGGAR